MKKGEIRTRCVAEIRSVTEIQPGSNTKTIHFPCVLMLILTETDRFQIGIVFAVVTADVFSHITHVTKPQLNSWGTFKKAF